MSTQTPPPPAAISTLNRVLEYSLVDDDPRISHKDALHLGLLLAGERPAVHVSTYVESFSEVEETVLHEFVETLSLPSTVNVTSTSGFRIDDTGGAYLHPESFPAYNVDYTITRDVEAYRTWRQDRRTAYHESLGRLLGYPDSAIDWFVNTRNDEPPNFYAKRHWSELLFAGDLTIEDVKYLTLVPYVPPSTPDGIEEAIELGEHYVDALNWFSSEFDVPLLTTVLDEFWTAPLFEKMQSEETNPYV